MGKRDPKAWLDAANKELRLKRDAEQQEERMQLAAAEKAKPQFEGLRASFKGLTGHELGVEKFNWSDREHVLRLGDQQVRINPIPNDHRGIARLALEFADGLGHLYSVALTPSTDHHGVFCWLVNGQSKDNDEVLIFIMETFRDRLLT
jgi:hypothetical protein